MRNTPQLEKFGLTITQAAYWLDVEPSYLARALDEDEVPQWLRYCLDAMDEEYEEDPEPFQYFRLGAQLRERTWSSETARAAIPVLIAQAEKGEPISYGDLDAELRLRDPSRENAGLLQKYGHPLGIIGEVIEEIRAEALDKTSPVPRTNARMPPLEALVVRGRERLPGKGIDYFLISYLRLLGERAPEDLMHRDQDRRMAVERIHAEIYRWDDWSMLEKLARR
ncbi:hypothetical protein Rumeso_02084 [Rubellimicrobium mesophilum DSM 19309]|uniref:Uncharacterized protein n=1 Tax=Rubellimicrobium mesophilum DSM 19309 TaxID=442562 RepID=A0A017HPL4_9RHOB|nr:hypothetical protein [Rubellimicrobium mesophilum]EYD76326.1 hypothetical protein Rumeso_02084 [Rubellimicrobium mesophilum DSM 19309]